jgi:hypothetical protein
VLLLNPTLICCWLLLYTHLGFPIVFPTPGIERPIFGKNFLVLPSYWGFYNPSPGVMQNPNKPHFILSLATSHHRCTWCRHPHLIDPPASVPWHHSQGNQMQLTLPMVARGQDPKEPLHPLTNWVLHIHTNYWKFSLQMHPLLKTGCVFSSGCLCSQGMRHQLQRGRRQWKREFYQ